MRSIQIYDTTLRDGTQGEGVSLSLHDKLQITRRLDELGVDFIEGGYPLSNEKDAEYFQRVRELDLKRARICAFGMTRRRGIAAAQDPGMQALVDSQAPVCTIVGKTWDFHVTRGPAGLARREPGDDRRYDRASWSIPAARCSMTRSTSSTAGRPTRTTRRGRSRRPLRPEPKS